MAKYELSIYEVVEKHLYESREDASKVLSEKQMEVKDRLMLCISKKLEEPLILDSALVTFLMNGCGGLCPAVSKTQAYRDVSAITKIAGNMQLSSKAWYRYMIVEGAKEGFETAKKEKDAKGMAACLDKIGKYTRADKEDDTLSYDDMLPPVFEPTDDVTVLDGMEEMPNLEEQRKEFRTMFKSKFATDAVDTPYHDAGSPSNQ